MSRQDEARLGDIVDAIAAIRDHLTRGDLHDGLVYDAVRVRLIEIGDRGAQGGVVSCQRGPHGVRMLGPRAVEPSMSVKRKVRVLRSRSTILQSDRSCRPARARG